MGVHRWDKEVDHEADALRILFTLSEVCNKCLGPFAGECPCPIMDARNQALDYLKLYAYELPEASCIPDGKLRRVVEWFEKYDKQWFVPSKSNNEGSLLEVNPAWEYAKVLADEILREWEYWHLPIDDGMAKEE